MKRLILHWLSLGAAQALGFLVVAAVLLLLNSTLVASLFQVALDKFPGYMRNQRINQGILFVAPVLLLVLEYWLYDRILDGLFPAPCLMVEERESKAPGNHY